MPLMKQISSWRIMPELAKRTGATKELKASASRKWAGLMNTCKVQVEERILRELIYDQMPEDSDLRALSSVTV
ncbi:TnpV protein [bacterium D16-54]|nr:TnpV protein [bacterium D16-54]RKJ11106.1 TnpV protein [bacterium D16-56]